MKRKVQITPTPKKRRGKRKSTCSDYNRTEYFKDYYEKIKNDPEKLEHKKQLNREWDQSPNGKKCRKKYYTTITKHKRKIESTIIQKIKKEQTKKSLEYCPVKPGPCNHLKRNEFDEKICHEFNDEIISLWDINYCPAEKESK